MTTPKKTSRPRIDAVIRHIKAGSYDDDMGMLQGAIADRQRQRQEAVMGLVKQVFGDNYSVVPPQPRPTAPVQMHESEVLPGESPHVQPIAGDEDAELGADYESRSPVFGSIDVSAQSQEDAADANPPAAP
jgi:hypothetical protein